MSSNKIINKFDLFFNYLINNKSEILSLSVSIAIMFAMFANYYYIPFALVIIFFSYHYLNEKLFVVLSVIIMISFVGYGIDVIRDYFTVIAFLGLIYFFLKKYGLNFKDYPLPPVQMIYLTGLLLFTVIFITFLNGLPTEGLDAILRSTIFLSICYLLYAFIDDQSSIFNQYYLIFALFTTSIILSISVYYELLKTGLTLFLLEGIFARFAGIFGSFNTLAFIMSIITIIAFASFYSEKLPVVFKKYFIPLFIVNNLFIIFLTNSRAAILALIVGVLFLFYHINKKLILVFFGLCILFFMIYFLSPFVQKIFEAYLRLETAPQRKYLWAAGVEIMKDYPLFGVGVEMFQHKFYSYVPSEASFFFDLFYILHKPHPHNFSLWLIAENGILGWIAAIALFGIYFFMGFRLISKLKLIKNEDYYFALSLTAIGVMAFVRSFFEIDGIFSYGYISRDLPFWISYILLAYFYKKNFYFK